MAFVTRSQIRSALGLVVLLAACAPLPDTVGQAAPSGTVWNLVEVNGAPATYGATLRLLGGGRVLGTGPCNRFEGRQTAPLPWAEFDEISVGGRDCPQAREEQAFLIALQSVDFAEVGGDSLLLSGSGGQTLFFRAAEGPSS